MPAAANSKQRRNLCVVMSSVSRWKFTCDVCATCWRIFNAFLRQRWMI